MGHGFLDIAVTPKVRAVQAAMGSALAGRPFSDSGTPATLTAREAAFIGQRDGFFMATVSETGWPYVQHRGGPAGFLKVLDGHSLAFADYRGNRQYISVGNLAANDRAALILVDHAARTRLKLYARVESVSLDADPDLAALTEMPGYRGRPERVLKLHVAAFDWNCPQHITPRFTEAEIADAVTPLHENVAALNAEIAALRARLGATGPV